MLCHLDTFPRHVQAQAHDRASWANYADMCAAHILNVDFTIA